MCEYMITEFLFWVNYYLINDSFTGIITSERLYKDVDLNVSINAVK